MHKVAFATGDPAGFSWKALLIVMACSATLLVGTLRAQDDGGAAPPPPPDANAPTGPATGDVSGAGNDTVTFQTFYDALSSMGTWIQSDQYGYVWQPQVSDPSWAPYTDGHWVYTDAGWTWASDEPWGWATYHYGRWVNLDGYGWCWVPGYVWAPAWVSWRYGDGNVGWAPLPPDSFVGVDYSQDGSEDDTGFHIGSDVDEFYDIGPAYYVFLPVYCLNYRHYHGYYCHRGDNYSIIGHTKNVTNINVAKRGAAASIYGSAPAGRFSRVTTGGPSLEEVNAASTTPMQKVTLVPSGQPGGGTLNGSVLALYAPHINPNSTAQPGQVAGAISHAKINHGTDILQPLAVNSHLATAPATEAQVQQARIAQSHASSEARVVIDDTSIKPVLQTPLTSLKPTARQETSSVTFGGAPNATQHTAPNPGGFTPSNRTYSGAAPGENPNHVYPSGPSSFQSHVGATGTGGATESHAYVRPGEATTAPQAVPSTAPAVHQGSSGSSYSNGGASAPQSSGSGATGGGYNGGGNAAPSATAGPSSGGGYQRH
jgi:hypothetical protein